jgi:signal transduction histidine kinase
MQKGATFGKPLGNGLGLYHAKEVITSWGGTIEILSKVDIGTSVQLYLPKI